MGKHAKCLPENLKKDATKLQGFFWLAGYYYHAPSGYYYDANSGLYFDSSDQHWKSYDESSGQYIAVESQAEATIDPTAAYPSTGIPQLLLSSCSRS